MNQELVRSLIEYNPDTGVATWKQRTSEHISRSSSLKSWNTQFAGKQVKTVDGKGYYHFSYKGKFYRLHRMIWLYVHGEMPNIIDHINGDRLDNRLCNLRNTNQQSNSMNQRRSSKNTSGVAGVYKNKRSDRWCAQMKFNGKTYHLGSSKSFFEAICMRKSEERRLGFSLDHGVR